MKPQIFRKLELIAYGLQKKEAITVNTTQHPPCFESKQQYESWLDAVDPEMGSQPPARRDWPMEPNYCRDCNKEQRMRMSSEMRCLFPSTVFITVGRGEDEEIVGTSR